ncbi:UV DNA damage repair endonuclease UvsE [Methanogenium organophilum]|uniref:UV DNA damage repair endonuclease UvsE n=1 Tax=Methanogenium organophilum TaxID=2199 RepID=A0A9X9S4U7_METOG|nr:UV DNA damage repair endonuclease UvsE [Methanogenium organophilum]WAI01757.1 UV DNA damage repair endonuclease UvsE [Methanogenium organophilum]
MGEGTVPDGIMISVQEAGVAHTGRYNPWGRTLSRLTMKIGYPCINQSLPCRSSRTFRLRSYTDERLLSTVEGNLRCLGEILRYNASNGILFFRITSDLVPFASHPVCTADWQESLQEEFAAIGTYIRDHHMRISMHPDQFIVLNAKDPDVLERSVAELAYHAEVLDLLGLDATAKIQLHVGGVYGDREESIGRFIDRYLSLDEPIVRRLVIENDDRRYTSRECLRIHAETGIPVIFDTLHHRVNASGEEPVADIFPEVATTWGPSDGIPMVDYSTQDTKGRPGKHAATIDIDDLLRFTGEIRPLDVDIMLEIKDKEASALRALAALKSDVRLIRR